MSGDDGSKETGATSGLTLYQGLEHRVFLPNPPKISPKKGLHVQISGLHDSTDSPKGVLRRLLLALGSAKAVAESAMTQDCWANTRINADQTVSVFGRVPGEEDSWRRPAPSVNEAGASLEGLDQYYHPDRLERLFEKYMPSWEAIGEKISLFDNGVSGVDEEIDPKSITSNPIIWTNGRFRVKLMQQEDPLTKPWLHINGFHLVIEPIEGYQRQWQTIKETADVVERQEMIQKYIQMSMEGAAIALGVRQLLAGGKGEIHNSGNWAIGLKTIQEDPQRGRLDLEALNGNLKAEKQKHYTRVSLAQNEEPNVVQESDFRTGTHFHVYIPFGDKPLTLPPMWPWEAQAKLEAAQIRGEPTIIYEQIIAQWRAIKPLESEQIQTVVNKLGNGQLTSWLENNCRGKLK